MSKIGVIILPAILVIFSFLVGIHIASASIKDSSQVNITPPAIPVFSPDKSTLPEVLLFNLSFCPSGVQAVTSLSAAATLLDSNFRFEPHYLFRRIDDVVSYCRKTVGDPSQCSDLVREKLFPSLSDCQKTIGGNLQNCLDDKSYIKSPSGANYGSLHGRQEANQNIRNLCAWKNTDSSRSWWQFVTSVGRSCTGDTADTCWENQAKKAGLDTTKITECFNNQAIEIMDREIELAAQKGIKSAPAIIINNLTYPSTDKNSLKIGSSVINKTLYYTENSLKSAVCSSFFFPPKLCSTRLGDTPAVDNFQSCTL